MGDIMKKLEEEREMSDQELLAARRLAARTGFAEHAAPTKNTTAIDIATVCENLKELLLTKNAAYGDSALNPVRIFSKADPIEQIKVRIDDKLSRLTRGNMQNLSDETLEDTIRDLLGYFVLFLIARRRQKG